MLFLTLILSVGIISAADENATDNIISVESSQGNIDNDLVSAVENKVPISQDNVKVNQQTKTASLNTKDVKTQKTTTKENVLSASSSSKVRTIVEADQIAVKYKKNSYFKIEVEDRYDDDIPISHVKLNVKVGDKLFKVKTNAYGIVKINTKSLKIGNHKVRITSADDNYVIKKSSRIFVGKQYSAVVKPNENKVLKNKDVIGVKIRNDYDDYDEKVAKVVFKKKAKATKITKALFYLKNKYTGKVVVKKDKSDFDDGRWEYPDEDYSNRYSLLKVKVYYISYK